jgi:MoxR-like ATPase
MDARNLIVGRDAELGAVDAFLTTGRTQFAVLTLEGEAGIGKTTIWLEALRRAGARRARVLLTRPARRRRPCPTLPWRTCSTL